MAFFIAVAITVASIQVPAYAGDIEANNVTSTSVIEAEDSQDTYLEHGADIGEDTDISEELYIEQENGIEEDKETSGLEHTTEIDKEKVEEVLPKENALSVKKEKPVQFKNYRHIEDNGYISLSRIELSDFNLKGVENIDEYSFKMPSGHNASFRVAINLHNAAPNETYKVVFNYDTEHLDKLDVFNCEDSNQYTVEDTGNSFIVSIPTSAQSQEQNKRVIVVFTLKFKTGQWFSGEEFIIRTEAFNSADEDILTDNTGTACEYTYTIVNNIDELWELNTGNLSFNPETYNTSAGIAGRNYADKVNNTNDILEVSYDIKLKNNICRESQKSIIISDKIMVDSQDLLEGLNQITVTSGNTNYPVEADLETGEFSFTYLVESITLEDMLSVGQTKTFHVKLEFDMDKYTANSEAEANLYQFTTSAKMRGENILSEVWDCEAAEEVEFVLGYYYKDIEPVSFDLKQMIELPGETVAREYTVELEKYAEYDNIIWKMVPQDYNEISGEYRELSVSDITIESIADENGIAHFEIDPNSFTEDKYFKLVLVQGISEYFKVNDPIYIKITKPNSLGESQIFTQTYNSDLSGREFEVCEINQNTNNYELEAVHKSEGISAIAVNLQKQNETLTDFEAYFDITKKLKLSNVDINSEMSIDINNSNVQFDVVLAEVAGTDFNLYIDKLEGYNLQYAIGAAEIMEWQYADDTEQGYNILINVAENEIFNINLRYVKNIGKVSLIADIESFANSNMDLSNISTVKMNVLLEEENTEAHLNYDLTFSVIEDNLVSEFIDLKSGRYNIINAKITHVMYADMTEETVVNNSDEFLFENTDNIEHIFEVNAGEINSGIINLQFTAFPRIEISNSFESLLGENTTSIDDMYSDELSITYELYNSNLVKVAVANVNISDDIVNFAKVDENGITQYNIPYVVNIEDLERGYILKQVLKANYNDTPYVQRENISKIVWQESSQSIILVNSIYVKDSVEIDTNNRIQITVHNALKPSLKILKLGETNIINIDGSRKLMPLEAVEFNAVININGSEKYIVAQPLNMLNSQYIMTGLTSIRENASIFKTNSLGELEILGIETDILGVNNIKFEEVYFPSENYGVEYLRTDYLVASAFITSDDIWAYAEDESSLVFVSKINQLHIVINQEWLDGTARYISDCEYGIYVKLEDDTYKLVDKISINDTASGISSPLSAGTYYITQLKAPIGTITDSFYYKYIGNLGNSIWKNVSEDLEYAIINGTEVYFHEVQLDRIVGELEENHTEPIYKHVFFANEVSTDKHEIRVQFVIDKLGYEDYNSLSSTEVGDYGITERLSGVEFKVHLADSNYNKIFVGESESSLIGGGKTGSYFSGYETSIEHGRLVITSENLLEAITAANENGSEPHGKLYFVIEETGGIPHGYSNKNGEIRHNVFVDVSEYSGIDIEELEEHEKIKRVELPIVNIAKESKLTIQVRSLENSYNIADMNTKFIITRVDTGSFGDDEYWSTYSDWTSRGGLLDYVPFGQNTLNSRIFELENGVLNASLPEGVYKIKQVSAARNHYAKGYYIGANSQLIGISGREFFEIGEELTMVISGNTTYTVFNQPYAKLEIKPNWSNPEYLEASEKVIRYIVTKLDFDGNANTTEIRSGNIFYLEEGTYIIEEPDFSSHPVVGSEEDNKEYGSSGIKLKVVVNSAGEIETYKYITLEETASNSNAEWLDIPESIEDSNSDIPLFVRKYSVGSIDNASIIVDINYNHRPALYLHMKGINSSGYIDENAYTENVEFAITAIYNDEITAYKEYIIKAGNRGKALVLPDNAMADSYILEQIGFEGERDSYRYILPNEAMTIDFDNTNENKVQRISNYRVDEIIENISEEVSEIPNRYFYNVQNQANMLVNITGKYPVVIEADNEETVVKPEANIEFTLAKLTFDEEVGLVRLPNNNSFITFETVEDGVKQSDENGNVFWEELEIGVYRLTESMSQDFPSYLSGYGDSELQNYYFEVKASENHKTKPVIEIIYENYINGTLSNALPLYKNDDSPNGYLNFEIDNKLTESKNITYNQLNIQHAFSGVILDVSVLSEEQVNGDNIYIPNVEFEISIKRNNQSEIEHIANITTAETNSNTTIIGHAISDYIAVSEGDTIIIKETRAGAGYMLYGEDIVREYIVGKDIIQGSIKEVVFINHKQNENLDNALTIIQTENFIFNSEHYKNLSYYDGIDNNFLEKEYSWTVGVGEVLPLKDYHVNLNQVTVLPETDSVGSEILSFTLEKDNEIEIGEKLWYSVDSVNWNELSDKIVDFKVTELENFTGKIFFATGSTKESVEQDRTLNVKQVGNICDVKVIVGYYSENPEDTNKVSYISNKAVLGAKSFIETGANESYNLNSSHSTAFVIDFSKVSISSESINTTVTKGDNFNYTISVINEGKTIIENPIIGVVVNSRSIAGAEIKEANLSAGIKSIGSSMNFRADEYFELIYWQLKGEFAPDELINLSVDFTTEFVVDNNIFNLIPFMVTEDNIIQCGTETFEPIGEVLNTLNLEFNMLRGSVAATGNADEVVCESNGRLTSVHQMLVVDSDTEYSDGRLLGWSLYDNEDIAVRPGQSILYRIQVSNEDINAGFDNQYYGILDLHAVIGSEDAWILDNVEGAPIYSVNSVNTSNNEIKYGTVNEDVEYDNLESETIIDIVSTATDNHINTVNILSFEDVRINERYLAFTTDLDSQEWAEIIIEVKIPYERNMYSDWNIINIGKQNSVKTKSVVGRFEYDDITYEAVALEARPVSISGRVWDDVDNNSSMFDEMGNMESFYGYDSATNTGGLENSFIARLYEADVFGNIINMDMPIASTMVLKDGSYIFTDIPATMNKINLNYVVKFEALYEGIEAFDANIIMENPNYVSTAFADINNGVVNVNLENGNTNEMLTPAFKADTNTVQERLTTAPNINVALYRYSNMAVKFYIDKDQDGELTEGDVIIDNTAVHRNIRDVVSIKGPMEYAVDNLETYFAEIYHTINEPYVITARKTLLEELRVKNPEFVYKWYEPEIDTIETELEDEIISMGMMSISAVDEQGLEYFVDELTNNYIISGKHIEYASGVNANIVYIPIIEEPAPEAGDDTERIGLNALRDNLKKNIRDINFNKDDISDNIGADSDYVQEYLEQDKLNQDLTSTTNFLMNSNRHNTVSNNQLEEITETSYESANAEENETEQSSILPQIPIILESDEVGWELGNVVIVLANIIMNILLLIYYLKMRIVKDKKVRKSKLKWIAICVVTNIISILIVTFTSEFIGTMALVSYWTPVLALLLSVSAAGFIIVKSDIDNKR